MKIHREATGGESERENGNRHVGRRKIVKKLTKKKKGKEEEWEGNKSTIAFLQVPACVRAAWGNRMTAISRPRIVRRKDRRCTNTIARNSRIYSRVTPIVHAWNIETQLSGWGSKAGKSRALPHGGCTMPIIQTSCFLVWENDLKNVKYVSWCRITLIPHDLRALISKAC